MSTEDGNHGMNNDNITAETADAVAVNNGNHNSGGGTSSNSNSSSNSSSSSSSNPTGAQQSVVESGTVGPSAAVDDNFEEVIPTSRTRIGTGTGTGTGNEPRRGCLPTFLRYFNRFCVIATYPIMIVFTLVSMLMIVTFCIFPTLLCLTFGTCVYYCLMEDPIPLSVLLRYMLSPNADDAAYPASLYPLSQQRPMIQSKLIVRKLLKIEDIIAGSSSDNKMEYPRKHPFPIHFSTDHKCLHFSEPLCVEEDKNDDSGDDDDDKSNNINNNSININTNGGNDNNNNNDNDDVEDPNEFPERSSENLSTSHTDTHSPLPLVDELDVPSISHTNLGHIQMPALDEGDETTPDRFETQTEIPHLLSDKQEDKKSTDGTIVDITIDSGEEKNKDDARDFAPKSSRAFVCTTVAKDAAIDVDLEAGVDTSKEAIGQEDYFGINESRDRGTTCDICLLDYEVGDAVAWSPNPDCTHTFHRDCVLDWLVRKPTCPNCRNDYLKGKGDKSV